MRNNKKLYYSYLGGQKVVLFEPVGSGHPQLYVLYV